MRKRTILIVVIAVLIGIPVLANTMKTKKSATVFPDVTPTAEGTENWPAQPRELSPSEQALNQELQRNVQTDGVAINDWSSNVSGQKDELDRTFH